MKFARLEVWELVTENDSARTHVFEQVVVRYDTMKATATRDGALVAELQTYDDTPVRICSDTIIIDGIAICPALSGKTEYAYWRLSA